MDEQNEFNTFTKEDETEIIKLLIKAFTNNLGDD